MLEHSAQSLVQPFPVAPAGEPLAVVDDLGMEERVVEVPRRFDPVVVHPVVLVEARRKRVVVLLRDLRNA